jgi:ADP-ribose pyrophosphatase YjhB (NUDIX family)
MGSDALTTRATARVLVLSSDERVLLIRHAVKRDGEPFVFWATPGGRIEPGERPEDAAVRELREELQLDLTVEGPVHEMRDRFCDSGVWVASSDTFFVAVCDQPPTSPHGATAEEMRALAEARWWTIDQIERSVERIFPPDLAVLLRAIVGAKRSASGQEV